MTARTPLELGGNFAPMVNLNTAKNKIIVSPRFPASDGAQFQPSSTKCCQLEQEEEKIFKKEGTRGQYYTMEAIKNLSRPKEVMHSKYKYVQGIDSSRDIPKSKSIEYPENDMNLSYNALQQHKSMENQYKVRQEEVKTPSEGKTLIVREQTDKFKMKLKELKAGYKLLEFINRG